MLTSTGTLIDVPFTNKMFFFSSENFVFKRPVLIATEAVLMHEPVKLFHIYSEVDVEVKRNGWVTRIKVLLINTIFQQPFFLSLFYLQFDVKR